MSSARGKIYEFGEYTLEVESRVLQKDGHPVTLTRKVFDLLLYLVQHPDRVIEKHELLSALWPETIVEESNLAQNVFVLRRTLADGQHVGRYIITVPGRGYRFGTAVRINPVGMQPTVAILPKPGFRRWRWAATLTVAGAVLAWTVLSRSPDQRIVAERQLTSNSAENPVTARAISRDAKYLAYADRAGLHIHVWLLRKHTWSR